MPICNQSTSQDCRFATNQRLDLRHRRKKKGNRAGFKTAWAEVNKKNTIILYSAQHRNQHKDAFAWIIYHDQCCLKPDKMYTCQRATAWHFSFSITWPNLRCSPKRTTCHHIFQRRKNQLGFSNGVWIERLNYLAGEKSGKYRNNLQYKLSLLSLLICSCTAVSYPSLFSRTCLQCLVTLYFRTCLYYWYQMDLEQYLNWAFKD